MLQLANRHQQCGWVVNTTAGVTIAIEGQTSQQQDFLADLANNLPPHASIQSQTITRHPPACFENFTIKQSIIEAKQSPFVVPDIATCQECSGDIFNPSSRFYRYPFTSCSYCGPRYSIMVRQPYDRTRTSMSAFELCQDCFQDYQNPKNRRFHAQTIACPRCGPQLSLLDASGFLLSGQNDAIIAAAAYLKAGNIVALKGIGGYQLLADAANQDTIERLRERKQRPQKPFAIMAADIGQVRRICGMNAVEAAALKSYAAPIVLLHRRKQLDIPVARAVAPELSLLGVMLPYSPLHQLLLHEFGAPLVATSGNRHDEPICTNDAESSVRLKGVADYFLTHNRPILRPLDDSVVRCINGNATLLRRARGYAPLPLHLKTVQSKTLALGGHLKNTLAVSHDNHIILSQHLGDLDSSDSQRQFQTVLSDLQQFYGFAPVRIMRDLHEGYVSSQFAEQLSVSKYSVQHHYAHGLSCMAEHGLAPPALAIVWDGAGLGDDNTLWGGEFLFITGQGYQRFAHFRPFPLPGGGKAIREPRRAALGLLYENFSSGVFKRMDLPFTEQELKLLQTALDKQLNCPRTSSAGRLFDATASLLGLCHYNQYEGQAAMFLENCAASISTNEHYQFELKDGKSMVVDWRVLLEQLLEDRVNFEPALIAAKFHNTLADIILAVAHCAGEKTVVLSGGCFQNAVLVEKTVVKLKSAGFNVYCHEQIPPNDGGLALGQIYAATFTGSQ